MINWHYETDFILENEINYSDWIDRIIREEQRNLGQLDYIFCNDDYLLRLNREYLKHDEYTDIITFDYGDDNTISGDVFISIPRVYDNARLFEMGPGHELLRVIAHGVLHLIGYKDKTAGERIVMRAKEEEMIKLFHVEH